MDIGKLVRLATVAGLAMWASAAWPSGVISGEGRGSGASFTRPTPLEELAGTPSDAVRMKAATGVAGDDKSIVCGLYIGGTWLFDLIPGATGGPRAYVYGAAFPNDLRIYNTALSCFPQTGTLRLEYWIATNGNQPLVNGGAFFGTRIAVFPNNGQLLQNQYFQNINGNAGYTIPTYGTYWLVLVLSQYQPGMCSNADGFCYNDSYVSAQMITMGNNTLNVSRSGAGGGTVAGLVNSPSPFYAIDCPAVACSASIYGGYTVTLTAAATAGSVFAGWSGGGCGGTGQCVVSMTSAQNVTAVFNVAAPVTYLLSVSKSGLGTVTSSPAGINCGATCSTSFNSGTAVVLTAAPGIGHNFTGWTGACTGTGTCNLTMSAARSVTANFQTLPVVPPPVPRVRTDFNGDNLSDILYRNANTGQVYRILMNGLSAVTGSIAYTEANPAWKIVADGDFNGDGYADLLWRNDATGQVSVLFMNASGLPSGASAVLTEPNLAWKIVHTADFDGDGKADILWWNSATGQVYGMAMNGAGVTAQGFIHTEANTAWHIVATGDFAGSGKKNQLLWRNSTTGQVYLQTASLSGGIFSATGAMIYQEADTAWRIVGAADFNFDGRSDILWRNQGTGQVYAMLMNNATVAGAGLVYTEGNLAWKIVAQGDYNGDGKSDLLWRNDSTGQVYMMLMNGLSIASAGHVYAEANTAWKVLGPWEYGQATGILADAAKSRGLPSTFEGEPVNAGAIGDGLADPAQSLPGLALH